MSILEQYVLLTVAIISTKKIMWSFLFILASPKNILLSVCSAKIIIYGYHYFIIWYDIDFIVFLNTIANKKKTKQKKTFCYNKNSFVACYFENKDCLVSGSKSRRYTVRRLVGGKATQKPGIYGNRLACFGPNLPSRSAQ